MRTRLIPYAGWIALALGGIGGTSCSNLDIGQERDAPGPLNVNHVVLLDSTRGINPDLLNDDAEKKAAGIASQGLSCDFANPCPPPVQCGLLLFQGASSGIFAPFEVEADGSDTLPNFCHDPENIQEVAPGPNSVIRVAFNKLIDDRIVNVAGEVDPTSITVRDSAGNAVTPAEIFYDRSGSPVFTSDPNVLPYGPALVFTPASALRIGETYTVQVNPAVVVARNNQLPPVASDLSFTFTVESDFFLLVPGDIRCPSGACATFPLDGESFRNTTRPTAPVALDYTFNGNIDISQAVIQVRDPSGTLVPIDIDVNGNQTIVIHRVDAAGAAQDWPVGDGYVVTITGVRSADTGAVASDLTATFDVNPTP